MWPLYLLHLYHMPLRRPLWPFVWLTLAPGCCVLGPKLHLSDWRVEKISQNSLIRLSILSIFGCLEAAMCCTLPEGLVLLISTSALSSLRISSYSATKSYLYCREFLSDTLENPLHTLISAYPYVYPWISYILSPVFYLSDLPIDRPIPNRFILPLPGTKKLFQKNTSRKNMSKHAVKSEK